ncbi:MAG: leucyl/phenylalanyl-tRNA--protein transferase [Bacteroidota bacterium]|nr:leucyl/phenylalanyl-tRNA--protein transferase [Bacteroidota bacterium]
MPLFPLNREFVFPAVELADADGLLAIGGDLQPQRLLLAYKHGIFPWYTEPPVLWWCPDPRFILMPDELRISRSMQKVFKKKQFDFTVNKAFNQVIKHCKTVNRAGQTGTWITEEMEEAYINLHRLGFAHSSEAWMNGELVGGMYGIKLGKVFFGESMFSTATNASKFVFIKYVEELKREGVKLFDCQVYTSHLESLGARMLPRKDFTKILRQLIPT